MGDTGVLEGGVGVVGGGTVVEGAGVLEGGVRVVGGGAVVTVQACSRVASWLWAAAGSSTCTAVALRRRRRRRRGPLEEHSSCGVDDRKVATGGAGDDQRARVGAIAVRCGVDRRLSPHCRPCWEHCRRTAQGCSPAPSTHVSGYESSWVLTRSVTELAAGEVPSAW